MSIKLSDYINDVDELLTEEEAEKLFIAAGYVRKDANVTHEVYDDRREEVLFQGEDAFDCADFIDRNYKEDHPNYAHIWIRRISAGVDSK